MSCHRHCHIVAVSSSLSHCGRVVVAVTSSSSSSHHRGVVFVVASLHCHIVALSVLSHCQCCHIVSFVMLLVLSCCQCCRCCHVVVVVVIASSRCRLWCCCVGHSVVVSVVVLLQCHLCRHIVVTSLPCHCCRIVVVVVVTLQCCRVVTVLSCRHSVVVSMDGPGGRTCHPWPALAIHLVDGLGPHTCPHRGVMLHHRCVVTMSPCHVMSSPCRRVMSCRRCMVASLPCHHRMVAMSSFAWLLCHCRMVAVLSSHGCRVVIAWLSCCRRHMVAVSCRVVIASSQSSHGEHGAAGLRAGTGRSYSVAWDAAAIVGECR